MGETKINLRNIVVGICLAILSGMVYAADTGMNLELPTASSFYTRNYQSLNSRSFDSQSFDSTAYLLAANEGDVVRELSVVTPVVPESEFKPPLISGRKVHQYLGLGTVMMAGLTMLAAPESCERNCPPPSQQPRQTSGTTHTRLARATAAMAAATVLSGLVFHWSDIHWEDPFTDPDKLHARLGAAGALLMIYAVNKSAHSTEPTSHAPIAELGVVTMLVAIKLTW